MTMEGNQWFTGYSTNKLPCSGNRANLIGDEDKEGWKRNYKESTSYEMGAVNITVVTGWRKGNLERAI